MRFSLFAVLFCFLLSNCAKIVAPTGGERDNDPPEVVLMEPAMESLNYTNSSIRIEFNEYIVADQLSTQLIVTPPLKEKPDIKVGSKSIRISWKESLLENTTYLFQFGDGIKDLNEGNILENFQVVFSTGPNLDTMQLKGTAVNAETGEPVNEANAFLYKKEGFQSSHIMDSLPNYICKIKEGSFVLNYLKPDEYLLYILQDENKDYHYQLNETVGFLAETISLPDSNSKKVECFLANPIYRKPTIIELNKQRFQVKFNSDFSSDSLEFTSPSFKPLVYEFKDSLFLFSSDSLKDSVRFFLNRPSGQDTMDCLLRKSEPGFTSIILPKKEIVEGDSIRFVLSMPLAKDSSINIRQIGALDTTEFKLTFLSSGFSKYIVLDSAGLYTFRIKPRTLIGINGSTNKLSDLECEVKEQSKFGSLYFNSSDTIKYLYQLMDSKGAVVFQSNQTKWNLPSLAPGQYKLRKLIDSDGNRKWTTGNALKRIEAERVIFYEGKIEIRANWEQEVLDF